MRELEAARDLAPILPVYYNLGVAQRAIGHNRAAIEAFRMYLSLGGSELPAERVQLVGDYIDALVGALGHVEIDVIPTSATVRVDGVPVPAGSTQVDLDPGRHTIVAEAPGFFPEDRTIDLAAGQRMRVAIAPRPAGRLQVEANVENATVLVDGDEVGRGSVVTVRLAPGRHVVVVRAPQRVAETRSVVVTPDGVTRETVSLSPPRPWLLPLAIGVGVVVVAGVVIGVACLTRGTEDPPVGTLGTLREAIRF